jgi:hypothetical protein
MIWSLSWDSCVDECSLLMDPVQRLSQCERFRGTLTAVMTNAIGSRLAPEQRLITGSDKDCGRTCDKVRGWRQYVKRGGLNQDGPVDTVVSGMSIVNVAGLMRLAPCSSALKLQYLSYPGYHSKASVRLGACLQA